MAGEFERAIGNLWTSLGLAPPRIGDRRLAHLTIEGHEIAFEESPQGDAVLVTGRIGTLAKDPVVRAAQTERLLRLGLALMAGNRGCVFLSGPDANVVGVQADMHYPIRGTDGLQSVVQDVLYQTEILAVELSNPSAAQAAPPSRSLQDSLYEAMIFRP